MTPIMIRIAMLAVDLAATRAALAMALGVGPVLALYLAGALRYRSMRWFIEPEGK